jgi:hypothetical protein
VFEQSTKELWTLLLVNYCNTQPVDKVISYDQIQGIIQFHPLKTREGRAIMRCALRDLAEYGFFFLVESGQGIYLASFYRRYGSEGFFYQGLS